MGNWTDVWIRLVLPLCCGESTADYTKRAVIMDDHADAPSGENRLPLYNGEWLGCDSNLNVRTRGTHGNTSSSIFSQRADIPVKFWTEETTRELISERGTSVIGAINVNGIPLLCDAVLKRQFNSAKLLLEYARENERFVIVETGGCPTLEWAIRKGSVAVASILTNYLFPLIEEFPNLMKDYLEEDKFSFEYGRFWVPYSMFEKKSKRPIAMTTNQLVERWPTHDFTVAKDFWITNCTQYSEELTKKEDLHVEVAAKFVCVNRHLIRSSSAVDTVGIHSTSDTRFGLNHVLRLLSKSNLPVEIFNAESLRTFANWLFYSLYSRYVCLLILDILSAVCFSLFAATYGLGDDEPSGFERFLALFLIIASFTLPLMTLVIRDSTLKIVSIVFSFLLMVHVSGEDNQTEYSAFLTSIKCILCWILVVEALLPFDKVGPFVSMVKYSLKAVIPFSCMGISVLLGFSFAFRVLFHPKFYDLEARNATDSTAHGKTSMDNVGCDGNSNDDFHSLSHVLKILFHACIGSFEEKAFRSTHTFIGTWRALLFNGFVFLGAIVLLSLLVAILSDIYDSVKLREDAVLIKDRAAIAGTTLFFIIEHLISTDENKKSLLIRKLIGEKLAEAIQRARIWFYETSLGINLRHKYFHYLVPVEETGKEVDLMWEGRIRELEKTFRRELREIRDRLKVVGDVETSTELQGPPADVASHPQKDEQTLDARMRAIEAMLSRMDKKLSQVTASAE